MRRDFQTNPRGLLPALRPGASDDHRRRLRILGIVTASLAAALVVGTIDFHEAYIEAEYQTPWLHIWPLALSSAIGLSFVVIAFCMVSVQQWLDPSLRWLERHYRLVLCLMILATAVGIGVCVGALRSFPNSGDEYDYLFAAKTFLAGRLWNAIPPEHEFFGVFHILAKDGKWVPQYPPGWPLLLAAGARLGMPFTAVSPVLALLLVLVCAHVARDIAGPIGALVAAGLLAFSPYFLFNAASYFSHVSAALFTLIFVAFGRRFLEKCTISSGLAAGAALGMVGLIRPFSAALVMLPFAIALAYRARITFYLRAASIAAGGLPFLFGLMIYNHSITGNPFLMGYSWGAPLFHIGLHPVDSWGHDISLLHNSARVLLYLFQLAEWTFPFLLLLYGAAIIDKAARRTLNFYDFIFPALIVGYISFPEGPGNQYGPRYYFDAYSIAILTIVSAAAPYLTRQDGSIPRLLRTVFAAQIMLGLAALPATLWQFHRVVNNRMEIYDLVARAHIENAIVFIASSSAPPLSMDPPDLARNGIELNGSVLYALDRGPRNGDLIKAFPYRKSYIYQRAADSLKGEIIPY